MGKVIGSAGPGWPWSRPRASWYQSPQGAGPSPRRWRPGPAPHACSALSPSLPTDKLVKCRGVSLLAQDTSWLLLLLLSLPLLQAMDFISL